MQHLRASRGDDGHRPLHPRKARPRDGLCAGNDQAGRVREGVRLGHKQVTEAFELQLDALRPDRDGAVALALGAALREALARRLGGDA